MPDLGTLFPAADERYLHADSMVLLGDVGGRVAGAGWTVANVDVVVAAERPRLGPHVRRMADNLTTATRAAPGCVSVKPKRAEGLGAIGRAEGIAAWAVALLER